MSGLITILPASPLKRRQQETGAIVAMKFVVGILTNFCRTASKSPVLKDYVVFWCDGGACALFSFDQFRDGGQACGRQGIVRGLVIMVVVVR